MSILAQGTIVPSGELVCEVPCGFSVSDEDQSGLVGLLGGGVTGTGKRRRLIM